MDYRDLLNNQRKKKLLHQEAKKMLKDIGPVGVNGNDERTWFQGGAFDDGYDFGDVTKTIVGSATDLTDHILGGALEIGEAALDSLMWVGGSMMPYEQQQQAKDFIKSNLYEGSEVAKYINPVGVADLILNGRNTEENSVFGEKFDSLAESGGQLVSTIGLQAVGVPWFLTSGVSAFGGEVENAFNQGASWNQAGASGLISAGAEILFEKLSGGIKFGGKTLDDVLLKPLTQKISSKTLRTLANRGIDALGEGTEEVLSSVASRLGSALYKEESIGELLTSEEAMDEYLESFIGGAVLGGGMGGFNAIKSARAGRDFTTGLTKNEQTVVDDETQSRIDAAEKNGKKLSNKEKNDIKEQVIEDLKKGYISIDTIERSLGGFDYESYKSSIEKENALKAEIEELENLPKEQITVKQSERLASARSELEALSKKTNELRDKTSKKVMDMLTRQVGKDGKRTQTDDYLIESYNEKGKRGKKFNADLSKYDEKQARIVKKAIDSGILNDTRRTHEFVDMVAKISADKGIDFDFANNAKLKESGFAVDGKTVNGFVNKDGVTVNIQSAKSLNSVVGHEITHVLEGTELYEALKETIVKYAQRKGEYKARYDAIKETYNNIKDADIDAELVADLVGDYLFTDTDFIKTLSTEDRNLFQKILDEIEYLWNIATAGSKEKRELERVRKAFRDAYRTETKANTELKNGVDVDVEDDVNTGDVSEFDADNAPNQEDYDRVYSQYKITQQKFLEASRANNMADITKYSEMLTDLSRQLSKMEADGVVSEPKYSLSSISNTFFGKEDMSAYEFESGDYKDTEGYKKYVDDCVKNMSQSRPDVDEASARSEIEDSIDGIVRVALSAKRAGYDIIDDPQKREKKDSKKRLLFSSLEPNSDYFTSSDISTECDKRKNFADIYDSIVRKEEAMGVPEGKRFFDNVDNYFYIHKVLADKGLTQPCKECYVESMRKNLAPMANAFLRLVRETDPNNTANDQLYEQKGKKKGELKSNNAHTREWVLDKLSQYEMTANDLTVETLTTEEGLAQLKIQAPLIYEAFNSFYGQSKPKMPKSATPFRFGELTALLTDNNGNINKRLVEKINHTGGFRLQSYSDFQIQNFTDVLQVIFEAGTLGLNGHAYTKVPAFLDATDGTNLKRNISIFMYKDGNEWKIDRNDSFPYSLEEIYDIVNSDATGNTSIIAVSQNNEMSAWIMANNNIGYGIPFHKSGLKMGTVRDTDVKTEDGRVVKGYSETKDHTKQQTEVWKTTTEDHKAFTKVKKGIDIYKFWDFSNADNLSKNDLIEKNLKNYIDACEEAGYIPKFRDYVMNNGKVLSDVLRYSKDMGFVSPDATISDISFEYKGYTIPYGYYKFLGDFGMFAPNGTASPQRPLSLQNYDFDRAVKFFSDSETLHRNEILQQFANGAEREYYRNSGLTAEQLTDIVNQKRGEVADEVVNKRYNSLSPIGENVKRYGNYNVMGEDIALETAPEEIAPTEVVAEAETVAEDIAPVVAVEETEEPVETVVEEDIAPIAENEAQQEESKTANVLTEEPDTENKKEGGFSRFVRNFVDKQAVFEKLALKTKNRELMAKADFLNRSGARAQRFIGKGTDGVRSLNDLQKEVENSGLTKSFYDYMYHKHNIDRMTLEERYKDTKNKTVFGDSVTADKSREVVAKYEAEHPEFTKWAQDVYDINKHLRKLLVDSGVISQETADLWEEMYPHYVPVRRVGDSGINVNVPLDTGRTGVNAPVKKATGGNRDILPLFDTMAMRAEQTYRAIARNSFGVELKNTLNSIVGEADTNIDEVIDSIDNHEELLKKGENGRNPTFTVFENGKRVTFEITNEMYEALKPTSEGLRYTNKALNTVGKLLKGVLTEYNPLFGVANAIKDFQDVILNSQHARKTYATIPKAIKEIKNNGRYYQEYLDNGGDSNTYFDRESKTFKTEDKGFIKTIGMPLRAISNANGIIETIPRLAEYIASREAGASIEVAMLDSARVTTNFSAGGDVTKFLNRNGATFLNASVQGTAQQVRNVREAKANGLKGWLGLATKIAIAGLPVVLLNGILWDDDEDYENLSDYVKDNYYIVAKYGDGKFVRIPKGRALAVIQNAFTQVSESATGDDELDFGRFYELFMNNVAPNNPMENNVLSPITQAVTNTTWYGDDLVPTRLQDLPAEEQYDETTDSFSKWLGETLGISPYKINYVLDQYSGGVGDVILPMLTPEAERGGDSIVDSLFAPVSDKFTTDSVLKNQNVTDFYTVKDELTTNAKSSKATEKDVLMSKYFNAQGSDMSELYSLKRDIQNSDLSDSEKYEYVREVQKAIDKIAEDSLNAYSKVLVDGDIAVVGNRQYKKNSNGDWVVDNQSETIDDIIDGLSINNNSYWRQKTEEEFASEHPKEYAVAKAVGGYYPYKKYSSDLSKIKADKDRDGRTISNSRKKKVVAYINSLDASYEEKLILYKREYTSDDTYNYAIIQYLNGRNDISYEEMETILKELGFNVDSEGNISW